MVAVAPVIKFIKSARGVRLIFGGWSNFGSNPYRNAGHCYSLKPSDRLYYGGKNGVL